MAHNELVYNPVQQVVGWGGVGAPGWAAASHSCSLSKGWARPAVDMLALWFKKALEQTQRAQPTVNLFLSTSY